MAGSSPVPEQAPPAGSASGSRLDRLEAALKEEARVRYEADLALSDDQHELGVSVERRVEAAAARPARFTSRRFLLSAAGIVLAVYSVIGDTLPLQWRPVGVAVAAALAGYYNRVEGQVDKERARATARADKEAGS